MNFGNASPQSESTVCQDAPVYEIVDAGAGEVLSRRRTRQAALDNWRIHWAGRQIRIEPRGVPRHHVVVAEGIWHESTRSNSRRGAGVSQRGRVEERDVTAGGDLISTRPATQHNPPTDIRGSRNPPFTRAPIRAPLPSHRVFSAAESGPTALRAKVRHDQRGPQAPAIRDAGAVNVSALL